MAGDQGRAWSQAKDSTKNSSASSHLILGASSIVCQSRSLGMGPSSPALPPLGEGRQGWGSGSIQTAESAPNLSAESTRTEHDRIPPPLPSYSWLSPRHDQETMPNRRSQVGGSPPHSKLEAYSTGRWTNSTLPTMLFGRFSASIAPLSHRRGLHQRRHRHHPAPPRRDPIGWRGQRRRREERLPSQGSGRQGPPRLGP